MKLHLGVIDIPYRLKPSPHRRKAAGGTVTTGDVAGFLENRYHVMEVFFRENEASVATAIESGLQGAIDSLLMGAPLSVAPFGAATSQIEDALKQWIATGGMDRLGYPGVPTQAAIDRASGKKRSARFKRRRATNASPVSFVDTGLYQASIKSWVD